MHMLQYKQHMQNMVLQTYATTNFIGASKLERQDLGDRKGHSRQVPVTENLILSLHNELLIGSAAVWSKTSQNWITSEKGSDRSSDRITVFLVSNGTEYPTVKPRRKVWLAMHVNIRLINYVARLLVDRFRPYPSAVSVRPCVDQSGTLFSLDDDLHFLNMFFLHYHSLPKSWSKSTVL